MQSRMNSSSHVSRLIGKFAFPLLGEYSGLLVECWFLSGRFSLFHLLMLCIDFSHARPFESKLSWLSLNRKVHFFTFSVALQLYYSRCKGTTLALRFSNAWQEIFHFSAINFIRCAVIWSFGHLVKIENGLSKSATII